MEKFIQAWEVASEPPDLSKFLVEQNSVVRRLTLIELIKVDLEYRQARKSPRRLEAYFDDFPELADDPPPDLIYEDYHIRANAGELVAAEEYLRRFPACASELARLLRMHAQDVSTQLVVPEASLALAEIGPGSQVDDFDLLTRLGKGAFASVFLARQNSMQRLVALKIS